MAYFHPIDGSAYRPTEHVGGGWKTDEQHVAPSLGLLAHAVEADRDARRDDGLPVARLSYDILGTIPLDVVDTRVRVLRPGRTIELVEATLACGGRDAVILRAWLLSHQDTLSLAATDFPPIPAPEDMPPWDPSTVWPGGFIASAEVRRAHLGPGRGTYWVRTGQDLIDGVPTSALARFAGLLDIANGMNVRADPQVVAFPNVDLTAHFFDAPAGPWVGFDTHVSFGPRGLGVTESVLHDAGGPIGTMSQMLTVRPG